MYAKKFCFRLALALILLGYPAIRASGQDIDVAALEEEAVVHLQEYLRVNTTNPPGNESRAVGFFAKIFRAEAIPYETATSAPPE